MSRPPSDRELDRLLAGLPRESASRGFTQRVLDGLDGPARLRRRGAHAGRRWLLAAAATAAALALGVWLLPRPTTEPSLAETRALREEHRLLMQELEAVKASLRASQAAPVIYLGGNEQLDLVLDLGPVWQGEASPAVRPAVSAGGERAVPASNGGGKRR